MSMDLTSSTLTLLEICSTAKSTIASSCRSPPAHDTNLSGGRLILPERLGNGLSGTGGLLVSESVSLAEDCDRFGTATSVDGTPCTEDEPNSLFRSLEISSTVSAC
ncbi:hypothetical protein TNCT_250081 [Trichonephila clavata]|uniref:Uncharacterized protein n=1 Tax=Trichonephila clavata TaxID=2740835 RepID=A0A8X6GSB7_TRICU|nr:hypothetical protein TNCT_250081 [Trichonephila clavata]